MNLLGGDNNRVLSSHLWCERSAHELDELLEVSSRISFVVRSRDLVVIEAW